MTAPTLRDAASRPDITADPSRSFLEAFRARLGGAGVGATLARGGVASLTVAGSSALLAFASQAIMARLLGRQFGAYVYVLTWVNTLAVAGVLGFDTGAVRFIGAYRGQLSWNHLRGFLRRSVELTAGVSALLGIAMIALGFSRRSAAEQLGPTLAAAGVLLPCLVTLRILGAQLQGFHRAVFGRVLQDLIRPGIAVVTLASLGWILRVHVTAPMAILINATVATMVVVVAWRALGQLVPAELREAPLAYDTVVWIRGAIPLLLIAVSQMLLNSTDTLMLGATVGTVEAGRYAVASQVASMITFAINSVNLIVAPMIAELQAQGRRSELQRVLTLSARGVGLFGLVALAVLVAAGGPLLRVFGPDFTIAHRPMIVLAVGQASIVFFGSVGYLMTMTGHGRDASVVIVASALVNIGLNAVLIPRYGLMGASVATCVSTVLRGLALTVRVRQKLGYNATAFGRLA
jgi:O-antigen/teichoic acid export membrane protein